MPKSENAKGAQAHLINIAHALVLLWVSAFMHACNSINLHLFLTLKTSLFLSHH